MNFDLTDAQQHAVEIRQLQLKIDAQNGQIKDLEAQLDTSKSGALRYQLKYETVFEVLERVLTYISRSY